MLQYGMREPIFLSGMEFQVLGRGSAMVIAPEVPYIVISITEPESPEARLAESEQRLAVLRLQFHDTERESELYLPLSSEQAEQIIAFVLANRDQVQRIVCHCEAGISRSAGVAAALAKWLTGEDKPFFRHFVPNRLVYRRVLEAVPQD